MQDLIHMFGLKENGMSSLWPLWIKVRQECEEHMETRGGLEGCTSSVITRMSTYYDPRNVPLPAEKCPFPCIWNQFTVVTRPCDSQRAVQPRRSNLSCLSGGLVQHCERGRPRPSRVWQHVCSQQLETRPQSSQAGAGRVCGEHNGIRWEPGKHCHGARMVFYFIAHPFNHSLSNTCMITEINCNSRSCQISISISVMY